MAKYVIDSIDQKILEHLINNARTPFLEIARDCGISGAAIHQRIKKLEESGVILGSQLNIDPKVLGNDVCAFIGVQISQSSLYAEVIEDLKKVPEIVECHFITGKYSIFVKLYCRDNEHLMHTMVNLIKDVPGISKTETFLSLEQSFERQIQVNNEENIEE